MLTGLLNAAGGLGLFLLGMSVMTEGLKTLADEKLRRILARSTRSPLSGFTTVALTTALIQSSSATTVAAVGLVHVGLLTFPESLGIIFGANVGTTVTGWIVALLGFKLKLGEIILPVILVGTLLRMMGRGVIRSVGTSVAGFGMIFIGISALQEGMAAFEGTITPDSFPPDSFFGRILLIAMGVLVTLITQSSSAGVATALAAVHTETISLHQAAAMVIGMDMGTTATAAMATIGGNIQARRTGLAHVVYNFFTAAVAFTLLTPFFAALQWKWPNADTLNPEISLVSFHSFYNLVCAICILPFTWKFAHFVEWLFPEHGNPLTKRLDVNLLTSADAALQAVTATLEQIVHELLTLMVPTIRQPGRAIDTDNLEDIEDAASRTRDFLEQLKVSPDLINQVDQYTCSIHILDHLQRIARRAHDQTRLSHIRDDGELAAMADLLIESVELLGQSSFPVTEEIRRQIQSNNRELKTAMRRYRVNSLRRTAAGETTARITLQRMDAARSIRRVGYHIWRIADHASVRAGEREA